MQGDGANVTNDSATVVWCTRRAVSRAPPPRVLMTNWWICDASLGLAVSIFSATSHCPPTSVYTADRGPGVGRTDDSVSVTIRKWYYRHHIPLRDSPAVYFGAHRSPLRQLSSVLAVWWQRSLPPLLIYCTPYTAKRHKTKIDEENLL